MIFELSQPNQDFDHKQACSCKMVLLRHLKPISMCQTGVVNPRNGSMAKFKYKSLTLWEKICIFPCARRARRMIILDRMVRLP